jgi:hypothetical protein
MVSVRSLPYLRPSPDLITVTDWTLVEGETEKALPDSLQHWDPGVSITVGAYARMDIEQLWQNCKLAEDDQLRLALVWNSPGTNLRGPGNFVTIHRKGMTSPFHLTVHASGTELAEAVKFELQLVLARPGNSPLKLAPHRPGSILWREAKTVRIGGEGARFPVEAISFASQLHSLPAGAGWFLDWDPTALDDPLLRSVRLFLNTDHKAIRKAIQGHAKEGRLLLEMIRFDVSKAMITAALGSEEFINGHQDYRPGTVGAAIRNMIHMFFSNETIGGLAGRYRTSPARIDCELQAHFKLFEEV